MTKTYIQNFSWMKNNLLKIKILLINIIFY